MGKQLGLPACDTLEPLPSPSVMSSQSFVFLLGPANQAFVEVTEDRMERRAVVAAVVVEPAPQHRIEHPGQIVECLVTALVQRPASHGLPHRFGRLRTDCGREVGEVAAAAILRLAGAKPKPQKVELILQIRVLSQSLRTIPYIETFAHEKYH